MQLTCCIALFFLKSHKWAHKKAPSSVQSEQNRTVLTSALCCKFSIMEVLVLTAVSHRHVLQTEERRNTLIDAFQPGRCKKEGPSLAGRDLTFQCAQTQLKRNEHRSSVFRVWNKDFRDIQTMTKTAWENCSGKTQLKYNLISLQAYIIFPIERVHKHPNVQQTEVL